MPRVQLCFLLFHLHSYKRWTFSRVSKCSTKMASAFSFLVHKPPGRHSPRTRLGHTVRGNSPQFSLLRDLTTSGGQAVPYCVPFLKRTPWLFVERSAGKQTDVLIPLQEHEDGRSVCFVMEVCGQQGGSTSTPRFHVATPGGLRAPAHCHRGTASALLPVF